MGYADPRATMVFSKGVASSIPANAELASFLVPAGREIELYNLRARASAPEGWAANAKLTDSAGTVYATVTLSGTQNEVFEASATASGPVRITSSENLEGGDTYLKIITDADLQIFKGTVQADFSYPGAK